MNGIAGIVDFGLCNLDSIARAVERAGWRPRVVRACGNLSDVDKIIIPGVGAFRAAMGNLTQAGLDEEIREERQRRALPILGICLGMHLLAELGHEGGETQGLGLLSGEIHKLPASNSGDRLPHIGWNEVDEFTSHPIMRDIEPETDFYFVHSYHFVPRSEANIIATTPYCDRFVSIAAADTVIGVQFHPEKSLGAGAILLRNFLQL